MGDHSLAPDATTSVMTLVTVKPGREADYETALHRFIAQSLESIPGQLGVYVLRPPSPTSREYGILRRFADREARDAFYVSPQYAQWRMTVAPLLEDDPIYRTLTGLETWVTLPGQQTVVPPPRWRMALLSWTAIFPLSLLIAELLKPLINGLHIAIRGMLISATLVTLMTFLVMPALTRLSWRWLYPRKNDA